MTYPLRIVAHRGLTTDVPGNTIEAFRAGLDAGIDAVELDVRLSSDGVPIVHHNWYLDENANPPVGVYARTAEQLKEEKVVDSRPNLSRKYKIPTLAEVLDEFAGRLGLDIEMKSPEPETPERVAELLNRYQDSWSGFEITSFHAALLARIRELCPGISTALLFPLSEPWMRLDVVAYAAREISRQARASAVHLHPSQLDDSVIATMRAANLEVHAHSINDDASRDLVTRLSVPAICTDQPQQALAYRRRLEATAS